MGTTKDITEALRVVPGVTEVRVSVTGIGNVSILVDGSFSDDAIGRVVHDVVPAGIVAEVRDFSGREVQW